MIIVGSGDTAKHWYNNMVNIDTTIKVPASMRWKEASNGIKITAPALVVAGYSMCFAYVPTGKTMRLAGTKKVVVNCLEGAISRPVLQARECITIKNNRFIQAETDSLLYLCIDETEVGVSATKMKSAIEGLPLQWIEPTQGCYRTDPKLKVGKYMVNLWYLIPNKNVGIHNHVIVQDIQDNYNKHRQYHETNETNKIGHKLQEQFIEFHTQLRGKGWMVKYKKQKEDTEYQRFELKIGETHPIFSTIKKGVIVYPWHAYVAAETGALFLAFEELIK